MRRTHLGKGVGVLAERETESGGGERARKLAPRRRDTGVGR